MKTLFRKNLLNYLIQKSNIRISKRVKFVILFFSYFRSSEEPVKPLSSSRPLIAVMLGIKSYSIETHPFYYTAPFVNINLDENFLDDFTTYGEMSWTDVPNIVADATKTVKALCTLCKVIADNFELVQDRRGQCVPDISEFDVNGNANGRRYKKIFEDTFDSFDECKGLPEAKIVSGDLAMGTIG